MEFIAEDSCARTVSSAHTTADYDTAIQAIQVGGRQITHLFNAMPPLHHSDPGVIGAAADSPDCMVELICDGVHIHPAVVRATFRLFGAERVILVSDTMRAAGMCDGAYTLGGQGVEVRGNRATLHDGTLAGSVTDLMACMKTAVSMGVPIEQAVTAAAVSPAKALGLAERFGSLAAGREANIVLLDAELAVKTVIQRGEIVFSAEK